MSVNPLGQMAHLQQMARSVVQFGQAMNVEKRQTLQQLQAIESSNNQASSHIMQTAMEMQQHSTQLKGQIIDLIA